MYCNPTYFESSGLEVIVVNAQHMKAGTGRKTDVKDAGWIADLLQHGLLQASFIPDKAQREFRELVGYRKSLVKEKSRETDMPRFPTDAHVSSWAGLCLRGVYHWHKKSL